MLLLKLLDQNPVFSVVRIMVIAIRWRTEIMCDSVLNPFSLIHHNLHWLGAVIENGATVGASFGPLIINSVKPQTKASSRSGELETSGTHEHN